MKFNTLRTRFALWTALLILLVLAVFGAYVYISMSRGLYAALDETLNVSASQIMASLNVDNGKLILPDSLSEPPEGETPPAGYSVRILSPEGLVLQQTGVYSSQLPAVKVPLPTPFYTTLNNPTLRLYIAPVIDNNQLVAIVQVAQSTREINATLGRLLSNLLIAAPLLLLAAAACGYFLAARALRPVDEMTHMARRISAEDLSARLNLSGDDEIGHLASTFDEMLARLEDSFRRERQFTSDASHELRTPLTAMQAILNVTHQRKRKTAEYEKALDDLSEEIDRLHSLTESLLVLARGDLHSAKLNEIVDLSTLLEDVIESLRPLAESKGLELTCEMADGLTVQGESDGLIRLFINLLDNAIKYTEQGGINVSGRREGALVHIEVSDTGIGIPESHLPHIFERFYQVEQSRSKRGTGLGLALAQQILTAHGGTISATSWFGKGSTFTVELPYSS
jgi:heavy metal sensor kinase